MRSAGKMALWAVSLLAPGILAAALLDVTTSPAGGGFFRYELTVNNEFTVPLSGLNLLRGGDVFGLDDTSEVSAPPGWSFFAPIPSLVSTTGS